jgi:hypothetical protein
MTEGWGARKTIKLKKHELPNENYNLYFWYAIKLHSFALFCLLIAEIRFRDGSASGPLSLTAMAP